MSKSRELADVIGTQNTTENVLQGRRNLIINGAMQVAQRGTSVTGLQNSPDYLTDRWSYRRGGTWASFQATMSNESTTLDGFPNSTKLQVATAETNTSAACWLSQRIEGQNLQLLKYGSSSAEQVTFSFWVKSNLTGTFTAFLDNGSANQRNYKTYTISSADTWEYKTITFTGNTSGAITNDNSHGMSVNWMLSGANSVATEDSWTSTVYGYVSSTTNDFSTSTSNYFEITGVQLEVGSVATPFEHRSYGEELALCQRYYQVIGDGHAGLAYQSGGNPRMIFYGPTKVTMRANPSISLITGNCGIDFIGFAGTTKNITSGGPPSFTLGPNGYGIYDIITSQGHADTYATITICDDVVKLEAEL